MRAYLDNNATTKPHPEVVRAMQEALTEEWGNPSSIHRAGARAKRLVEEARDEVAALLGATAREIIFTSGATEAVGLAIRGTLALHEEGRRAILSSRLEHSAVRTTLASLQRAGTEVLWMEQDENGVVDLDSLRTLLKERGGGIALACLMWANNETGHLQPIAEFAAICREAGVRSFTDATAAAGKVPIALTETGVDMATCSAHKFHGPKGAGTLFLRRGARLSAQVAGGGQERDLRGGTENVPAISGFGCAARMSREWLAGDGPARAGALRDSMESRLLKACEGSAINAAGAPRVWNTTSIAFPCLEAEALLIALSERGIAASAGAACSSGSLEASPVLLAMGIPEHLAHGSIRLSLSRETTQDEVDLVCTELPAIVRRMREAMRPVTA